MKKIIPFTLGALLLFAGLSIPLITKADNNLVPIKFPLRVIIIGIAM